MQKDDCTVSWLDKLIYAHTWNVFFFALPVARPPYIRCLTVRLEPLRSMRHRRIIGRVCKNIGECIIQSMRVNKIHVRLCEFRTSQTCCLREMRMVQPHINLTVN